MASGELMASERVEEEEEVDVGGDFIISRSKAYVLPKHDELISRQWDFPTFTLLSYLQHNSSISKSDKEKKRKSSPNY